jgi:chromosome segregation ATPase
VTTQAELIERLRYLGKEGAAAGIPTIWGEAADTIEAQAAEIAHWKSEITRMGDKLVESADRLLAQHAEIARLTLERDEAREQCDLWVAQASDQVAALERIIAARDSRLTEEIELSSKYVTKWDVAVSEIARLKAQAEKLAGNLRFIARNGGQMESRIALFALADYRGK